MKGWAGVLVGLVVLVITRHGIVTPECQAALMPHQYTARVNIYRTGDSPYPRLLFDFFRAVVEHHGIPFIVQVENSSDE